MTKSKNLLKIVIIAFIMMLSSVILFACTGENDVKREYISNGNGTVVYEKTADGEVYRAVPDKWYSFVGWYNGNVKYSDNAVLTIKKSTPAKMQARFATSAKSSFDRYLESFYNTYTDGENKEGEYFNYSLIGKATSTKDAVTNEKDLAINGYIDFNSSSQFAFEVKDKNSTDFALYYDNTENGTIYIEINGEKYTYSDIGLLTNLYSSLPATSQTVWNIDSLVNDENTAYLINQYFGIKNSMGFIKNVENNGNSSVITLSYHKILNFLKNIADDSKQASPLQKLIYALTCEYQNSDLPEMIIKITTNYQTISEREYVKDFTISYELNKDYTINFNGNKITLSQMQVVLSINSFDIGFSSQANEISNEVLASFPEATVNMINVHTDGELDFISEDNTSGETVRTVVDRYIIELDADLNPLALVSYKKDREDNYYDIEWEKLGFLSFRISLVPETDATALTAQQERHHEVYDYVNILLDTKNNGANVYFFLGLYTPNTLFTQDYIFNHSFNIPSLLKILENEDEVATTSSQVNSNTIMKMLSAMVTASLGFESQDPNEVVYELITEFLTLLNVNTEIIDNNMVVTDDCVELSLADIRTEVRNYEKDILRKAIGISGNIKLDKKIFGDDEEDKITHLSISMNKPTYNSVIKNSEGDYLNNEGEVIIDNFNDEHKVLVAISENGITELNNSVSIEDVLALKGKTLTISEGVLSDGTTTTVFANNKGKEKALELIVEDIEIVSITEQTAKVRVFLQFKDYPNTLPSIPMIGEEIYNLTGIPYGLILFEKTVQIA